MFHHGSYWRAFARIFSHCSEFPPLPLVCWRRNGFVVEINRRVRYKGDHGWTHPDTRFALARAATGRPGAPACGKRRTLASEGRTTACGETTDNLWALFFVGPQVIGLLVFSAIPLLSAFYLSLTNWDGFGNQTFVGIDNFVEQLQSPDLHIALWNSFVYTLIAVPGGLCLALLIAMGLSNIQLKTVYRLLYFMPVVTGSVAISVIWLYLLNTDFGIINTNVKAWTRIELPNGVGQRLISARRR